MLDIFKGFLNWVIPPYCGQCRLPSKAERVCDEMLHYLIHDEYTDLPGAKCKSYVVARRDLKLGECISLLTIEYKKIPKEDVSVLFVRSDHATFRQRPASRVG